MSETGRCVEIVLDKDRIKEMASEEKLNILIDIAFANHSNIRGINEVLTGNSEEGVVDKIRNHDKGLQFLWQVMVGVASLFITIGGALIGLFIYHIQQTPVAK